MDNPDRVVDGNVVLDNAVDGPVVDDNVLDGTVVDGIVRDVRSGLAAYADRRRAKEMARYMKTDMPFYGVPQPEREPVMRDVMKRYAIPDAATYEAVVAALWGLKHREEKYAALGVAIGKKQFITMASLPLYERLIREGAWWDLVDEVATHLISPLHKRERAQMRPIMDGWIGDDDMWIRRSAILSQIGHKHDTDADQLFGYCLHCAAEKEFFIRKAIGWALRDFSYAAPEAVNAFLTEHRDALSGLSYREGAKQLVRSGWTL